MGYHGFPSASPSPCNDDDVPPDPELLRRLGECCPGRGRQMGGGGRREEADKATVAEKSALGKGSRASKKPKRGEQVPRGGSGGPKLNTRPKGGEPGCIRGETGLEFKCIFCIF